MKSTFAIPLVVLLLTACGDNTYTLYRNSATSGGESRRMHVATFDAKDGEAYNMGNCQIAEELFQKQPGVTVKFWCEKGVFKK
jgi:hypothetical protein|uniref:hypothetical protein n=1 Tax=Polynucleobacter sp. TaxID=2029855 RepID=UPI00404842D9